MTTKVKICGLTNLEDALVAVEAGADLLGFIFYEPSPRYVRPEVVREIVSAIRNGVLRNGQPDPTAGSNRTPRFTLHALPQFVGVFVNASLDTVIRTLDDCRLDLAQLHGDEPPEFVVQLRDRAFKALRPQSPEEAEALLQTYRPSFPFPRPSFLIDAYHPALYGGTGHVSDWSMAAGVARRYPTMLAGSLTPANVAQAIRAVSPWGVDVSSGVERTKGWKDHQKVREFVKAAKYVTSET
jgi:phosphoribosylanthranilate isomerase